MLSTKKGRGERGLNRGRKTSKESKKWGGGLIGETDFLIRYEEKKKAKTWFLCRR